MEDRRMNDTTAPSRSEPPMTPQSGTALVDRGSMVEFDRRWNAVQADFVEDPRRAVGEAGNLLAELMEHVAKNLRQRRTELDRNRANETDTEAMRLEMRRYRELMNRMVRDDASSATPQTPAQPATRPPERPARRASD